MTIYIDDSGTRPENAVAVAAGWMADTDSWVDFQADWDKASDIGCGQNAGVRTILVQTGYGAGENNCRPDWIARDIAEAAEIILKENE